MLVFVSRYSNIHSELLSSTNLTAIMTCFSFITVYKCTREFPGSVFACSRRQQGMYVCMYGWMDVYVCMYVCMYVCVWGLVVKWFVHWAHDPWVMGSSPTTRRWILSNLLPLPPTTPTSPPSCEWVPGVSWGANHSSFSLNSSGPGGTSGAHTTCCEKVAGPPASF